MWSECTTSCGSGERERNREIRQYSNFENCNQDLEEIDICNTNCCPVDGFYSAWSEWSECSATCNNGIRKRYRNCDSPKPICGGSPCDGRDEETENCNTQPCAKFCENGKVLNNCSNKCELKCSTLACLQTCHEPDTCTPGCVCPPGTVENENRECITEDKCLCSYENKVYLPGQKLDKECESW